MIMKNSAYVIEIVQAEKETRRTMLNTRHKIATQITQITQLTSNWNELEEWLKEYIKKNDNWYNNELSTYDKQYYGDSYYTTNYMLEKFLDKMKEIKEKNNASR